MRRDYCAKVQFGARTAFLRFVQLLKNMILFCHMENTWRSPYQTQEYYNAMLVAGVPMRISKAADGRVIYFDESGNYPIAWEVSADIGAIAVQPGAVIFKQRESSKLMRPDSYYTLAISQSYEPSKRFKRNVRKGEALAPHASLHIAETSSQIRATVDFFQEFPDRRDGLSMDNFRHRVIALGRAGVLVSYVLQDGRTTLAVAHTLKSDSIVNMRYYSASRCNNVGHMLHHRVIEEVFTSASTNIIDLSGVSPFSVDKKMQGIDEFKKQIGGELVEFEKISAL